MTNSNTALAILITIPLSHYCEKARWALDRVALPYREEPHAPLLHRLATKRNDGGVLASALLLICLGTPFGLTTAKEPAPMIQDVISESTVVDFLRQFDELADKKDFGLIADMIHERAFFRFNDGDFVGRHAVKAAFERTWQSGSDVQNQRFFVTDIVVLSADAASATATYTYNWHGVREGRQIQIQGRGTRVLVRQHGRLQIIHEHLSRFPKAQ